MRGAVTGQVVCDAHSHRAIHLETGHLVARGPPDFAALAARDGYPTDRSRGEDNRELLAGLAVTRIEDHVLGIGIYTDQARDLARNAGLFPGLANSRFGQGLA